MTVSRTMRGSESVTPETRRRVQDAARSIGYVPDRAAGALKAGTGNLVGAIMPNIHNILFAEMLQGLGDGLNSHALALSVGISRRSRAEERRLVGEFLAMRPCGIVLHDTQHLPETRARLQDAGIPIVELGDLPRNPIDMAVSFSNRAAARAVTTHLIGRGYRRIAFVSIPFRSSTSSRLRMAGYRDALRAAGLPFDEDRVIETPGGYPEAEVALDSLWRITPRPDAIFGASDVLAVGMLLAAQRRGISVPRQLAVAGFDDHAVAGAISPRLTSLSIPRYRMGATAADAIVARIRGQSMPAISDLGFELIEGEST
ncbi:LacI family DNA-binding transcriptional regulator [Roseomonas marmotae]|uniref:LacI family DNA-binding transcriptional regulator n=2 Tax=Roseomonas marmotae TaxID=2768161 RepID=A0ABS3K8S3_9PROT|nr:LacI family DNA-binding transcriptional regulator [Roseomonas marmotae]QTI81028.1 LacI family DNA-binding transcriptional regulator [Roseomonas marmotae]